MSGVKHQAPFGIACFRAPACGDGATGSGRVGDLNLVSLAELVEMKSRRGSENVGLLRKSRSTFPIVETPSKNRTRPS